MAVSAWFLGLDPVVQALLGTTFTWGVTAAGSATIFLVRNFNRRIMDVMLGFAAGVMIAASYWSLLAPAIAMAESQGMVPLGAGRRRLPARAPASCAWPTSSSRTCTCSCRVAQAEGPKSSLRKTSPAGPGDHPAQHPRGPGRRRRLRRGGGRACPTPPSAARSPWPSASACRTSPKARPSPSRSTARASRAQGLLVRPALGHGGTGRRRARRAWSP